MAWPAPLDAGDRGSCNLNHVQGVEAKVGVPCKIVLSAGELNADTRSGTLRRGAALATDGLAELRPTGEKRGSLIADSKAEASIGSCDCVAALGTRGPDRPRPAIDTGAGGSASKSCRVGLAVMVKHVVH